MVEAGGMGGLFLNQGLVLPLWIFHQSPKLKMWAVITYLSSRLSAKGGYDRGLRKALGAYSQSLTADHKHKDTKRKYCLALFVI